MANHSSINLGNRFEQFVRSQVTNGRYESESEVVRAGLRLLEEEENKLAALQAAIQKGLDSPRVENFDFKANLKKLKEAMKANG